MHVLVVKTSSLGDLIHTLPALTDAVRQVPEVRFDWVAEEGFAEIATWHPAVDRVIPVALRRWRRHPGAALRGEWGGFLTALRARPYDRVVDAQGLVKSAVIARFARGPCSGLSWRSAREPLASIFYRRRLSVHRAQHAIARLRQLFAAALDYTAPEGAPDYGLPIRVERDDNMPFVVFLHGTTWDSKLWPEPYWVELAQRVVAAGYGVKVLGSTPTEQARARRIADTHPNVQVQPPGDLNAMARVLRAAAAVVSVDTGLVHLAAALDVPAVTLYGATSPELTGTVGRAQVLLRARFQCAPCLRRHCTYAVDSVVRPACYESLSPGQVWLALRSVCRRAT